MLYKLIGSSTDVCIQYLSLNAQHLGYRSAFRSTLRHHIHIADGNGHTAVVVVGDNELYFYQFWAKINRP